ncbi:MAG: transketolase [Desulfobacteraceae bacterium]|nr:MAG: transketolase [Desulfobacteraceae bacterium]
MESRSANALELDQCCINTIRTLSMDAIQRANSGHPGAPMGLAPAGYVLWTRIMNHNPRNPDWPNRDRFVLSGGHASMLLYSLLFLTGYDVSLEDIKKFRQWGSKTPGHPEYGHTPGVETTTGPLGQGLANAVGMAMAERHLAARFNQPGQAIVDHYTYAICGDGDLMEGVASEAASLAGHLGLGRLICIYDDNDISIEGSTDIAFTENVGQRFAAYNWHVLSVEDGNDPAAIEKALRDAKAETQRPSLIVLHTHIAYGSPNKQDSAEAHGAPLGEAEVCLTKGFLGCDKDLLFCVPEIAFEHCRQAVARGQAAEEQWQGIYAAYTKAHPKLADEWVNAITGFLARDWDKDVVTFKPQDGAVATRAASGKTLAVLADRVPTLMGGSADLAPSNNTFLKKFPEFQKGTYEGRNIRFGVREHAMGAIMSGLFLHGGIRPYGGTFLVFADYVRPAIRVAALMKLPLIYVFTHDSIAVGEDGPTHQPVEHLASLRAIPNLLVLRPCDANETVDAWICAIRSKNRPVVLALSRQNLPVLDPGQTGGQLVRGGYVLSDCQGKPDVILIGTGAEVHLALNAQKLLAEKKISARVVNMPSWELFEENGEDYKSSVLPPDVTARLAVEAGIPMGWERYVGSVGKVIGINGFGASAPGSTVLEKYGFTAQHVASQAEGMVKRE